MFFVLLKVQLATISNFPAVDFWTSCRSNGELLEIDSLVTTLTKDGIFEPRIAPEVFPSSNPKPCVQLFQAKYSTCPNAYLTDVTDLEAIEESVTEAAQQLTNLIQQQPKNATIHFIIVAWKKISDKTYKKFVEQVQELAGRQVNTIVCDKEVLMKMYGPSLLHLGWFMEQVADTQTTPRKRKRADTPSKSTKKQKLTQND